ncbi:ATP-binding protein [Oscillospiraceae bacterium LTW-04]|nr:ATP-binding protein [Oscillospiraceae bacterium MB24-C1]
MTQWQNRIFGQGKAVLNSPSVRVLLIGVAVALASQLYFLPGVGDFRFSGAVILYPVLLAKMFPGRTIPVAGAVTAGVVWLSRAFVSLVVGHAPVGAALAAMPGALFYLCYDTLFCLLVLRRDKVALPHFLCGCFVADMLSNMVEIGLSTGLHYEAQPTVFYLILTVVALGRALCATGLFWWLGYYRRLLLLEERERRYQRLFLMTAQLKDELYFLKKTAGDIERVMGKAYELYEGLADGSQAEPGQNRQLALTIARDVHEVKKGHLRILKGIESEVEAAYDREVMHISDLMKILKESARKTFDRHKPQKIRVLIGVEHDFVTREHHRLMSILRNLVTNAIEAMEQADTSGTIRVEEFLEEGNIVFRVEDDGPGVPPRMHDKIFNIGYSTKFNPVTGDINRGVGLTAVKSLTEELGGSVTMETVQGHGCLFLVRIPCAQLEEDYADLHH